MAKPRNITELMHHWAHSGPNESAQCGNVRYQNGVLYSYAEPIALLLFDGQVIISEHRYSNTTTGHQWAARRASSHLRQIYAPKVRSILEFTHSVNKEYWERSIKFNVTQLRAHPRRKVTLGREINHAMQAARRYSNLFNLGWTDIDLEELSEQVAEEAENVKRRDEAQREAEKQRKADRIAEQQEKLALWRKGEEVYMRFERTALRIKGDEVQTSHGAVIPLEDAKRIWPAFSTLMQRGEPWRPNNIKLGHYRLTSFNADGNGTLVVGCHTIPWQEIQDIASQLELSNAVLQETHDGLEQMVAT